MSSACKTRAAMNDPLGSGVPFVRLRIPASRWKVMVSAMLLKQAVITPNAAMAAT
jgi:hypothetical protein